jgi:hypothetical protein
MSFLALVGLCEVTGRLDEQIEQLWSNLCGFDGCFDYKGREGTVSVEAAGNRRGRVLKKKRGLRT